MNWNQIKDNTWRFIFMCLFSLSLTLEYSVRLSLSLYLHLAVSLYLWLAVSRLIRTAPLCCWAEASFINSSHIDLISLTCFKIKSIAIVSIVHCSFNLWNTQGLVSGGSTYEKNPILPSVFNKDSTTCTTSLLRVKNRHGPNGPFWSACRIGCPPVHFGNLYSSVGSFEGVESQPGSWPKNDRYRKTMNHQNLVVVVATVLV